MEHARPVPVQELSAEANAAAVAKSSTSYGHGRLLAVGSHRRKHDSVPTDPREELTRYDKEFVTNGDGDDILKWWKVRSILRFTSNCWLIN